MVTANPNTNTKEVKEKRFKITVYKERFYAFLQSSQVAELEYMDKTEFHGFHIEGTSDDPKITALG